MLTRLDDLLKKYHALATWLLILVGVTIYQRVLTCGFVFDDVVLILQNPFVRNPLLWKKIFLGPLWSFAGPAMQGSFYRPLDVFSFWVICRVAGYNPAAYHLFQLVLYALTIWLVYRIGRKILQNELAAFAGALLWAVHPLHVEAVAWIAALSEIGYAFFCLLGFWFFLRAEDDPAAPMRWHVVAAVAYFPALFFKEAAFSFPLLPLAYWFCHSSRTSWLRRALYWLPYLGAAAVCAVIRVAVMGRFSNVSLFRSLNAEVIWAAAGLLGQHAKLFFWPVGLSEFREFHIAASLRSPWPWAALLALGMALVWRKRDPRLSFPTLWWGLMLAPVLNFRQLSVPLIADRFSYLPSVGLCLALGYVAAAWMPRHFPRVFSARVLAPALGVVAIFWAVQTVRAIPHWRSNETLFAYSLRTSPNAGLVHLPHAELLQFIDHDIQGAAGEFHAAIRLNAQSIRPLPAVTYNAYVGLGEIALREGREAEALDYFNRAVRVFPDANIAYDHLGAMYFPRGDYARAAGYFQQAVQADPQDVVARFFLGTCRMKLGQPAQAAAQFHAAREVDTSYFQAFVAEAAALEAAGDKAGAERVRREMLAK